jgi:molecular chaperone HscB
LQADPFQILGVAPRFDLDFAAIEARHRELSRILHPDRHAGRPSSERRQALSSAIEVNEALRALKDPVRRAELLLARRGVAFDAERAPPASPAFLMQVLEEREELAEAERTSDRPAIARLAKDFEARRAEVEAALTRAFADWSASNEAPPASEVVGITEKLGELRYLKRLIGEARAIEDELP